MKSSRIKFLIWTSKFEVIFWIANLRGHSGSPATVGPHETPEKTSPPQKVPISRFYLLSLLKTRSDSPGAAPPQNFPILKHYASSSNIRMSRVFLLRILGRRCFEQTQQIKAANRNLLGRRSFFGGLVGTRGRRGATVPPSRPMDIWPYVASNDLRQFWAFLVATPRKTFIS